MFLFDQLWSLYEFHHGRLRRWLPRIVRGMQLEYGGFRSWFLISFALPSLTSIGILLGS